MDRLVGGTVLKIREQMMFFRRQDPPTQRSRGRFLSEIRVVNILPLCQSCPNKTVGQNIDRCSGFILGNRRLIHDAHDENRGFTRNDSSRDTLIGTSSRKVHYLFVHPFVQSRRSVTMCTFKHGVQTRSRESRTSRVCPTREKCVQHGRCCPREREGGRSMTNLR